MFGPETQVPGETEQNQDPTKGQINFFSTPYALRQVTGRQQVYENPCECV